uniref:Uncharacterized protein n=1 Tax=Phyllosticta capitalensis polymycovirus 2 TaxID=3367396 RepID=A0AB74UFG9_9VIRU
MADLASLRSIVLRANPDVCSAAAMIYHLSPSVHSFQVLSARTVSDMLAWLEQAPLSFYGDVMGSVTTTQQDVSLVRQSLDGAALADVATLVNSMYVRDENWDRQTRNFVQDAAAAGSAMAPPLHAHSAAEYAALDAVGDLSYDTAANATNALAVMRNLYCKDSAHLVRQYKRSRHSIALSIERRGRVYKLASPWCLSRSSANVYLAGFLSGVWAESTEHRAVARARTVNTLAARSTLDAVRAVLEPAVAILTNYTYDRQRLAFVDDQGNVAYPINSRQQAAAVAFAYLFSRGNADVLPELSRLRNDAVSDDMVPLVRSARSYYDIAADPTSAIVLSSLVLADARVWRDDVVRSPYLNKDPMLGYIPGLRTPQERNTISCINRCNEVLSCLRARGVDVGEILMVVEWGGLLHYDVLFAALGLTKVDVCVDVGRSGIDMAGSVAVDDDPGRQPCSYQFLLHSAGERMLPRMPRTTYSQSDTLTNKLAAVASYYSPGTTPSIVYVNGGATALKLSDVFTCDEAVTRFSAMETVQEQCGIIFSTAEIVIPRICPHALSISPQSLYERDGLASAECDVCAAFYRAAKRIGVFCEPDDTRIVKTRSAYGHNMHVSIEKSRLFREGMAQTMGTFDAIVACNIARNADWGDQPVTPPGGNNPASPALTSAARQLRQHVYALMSDSERTSWSDQEFESVAASLG